MAVGRCPKCNGAVNRAFFEEINVIEHPHGNAWVGTSYLCPHCRSVLSVQIDPLALKNDLAEQISGVVKKIDALADGVMEILRQLHGVRRP